MELQKFFIGDIVAIKKYPGEHFIVDEVTFYGGFRYSTVGSAWHFAEELTLLEKADEQTLLALHDQLERIAEGERPRALLQPA